MQRSIQLPPVSKNLLLFNIAVFVLTLVAEKTGHADTVYAYFALFYPTSPYFNFWQPLTYMFLHGGFFHVFFNMYTLFIFGPVIENIIGSKKFAIFYFACGLFAAAAHIAFQAFGIVDVNTPTVGASGAIYGVILAYAMIFPDNRMMLLFPPIVLSAKWMAVIFVAIELITGFTGTMGGVAHFAHLGGMVMGFLLIFFWRKSGRLFDRDKW